MYVFMYGLMLFGFLYCSFDAPDIRTRVIGILLAIANALIFYKGGV